MVQEASPAGDSSMPAQPLPPRVPQPFSADDINPECLYPVASSWLLMPLPAPAQPSTAALPPTITTDRLQAATAATWPKPLAPPAGPSQDPSAGVNHPHMPSTQQQEQQQGQGTSNTTTTATGGGPRRTLDLNKMSHKQLAAAVQKHNAVRNIPSQPVAEALTNVLAALQPLADDLQAHPRTLGGQPGNNVFTRGWRKVAKQKGLKEAAAAAKDTEKPEKPEKPGRKPPAPSVRTTRQNPAAPATSTAAPATSSAGPPAPSSSSAPAAPPPPRAPASAPPLPPRAPAPAPAAVPAAAPPPKLSSMYPAHVPKDQQEFNAALAQFLDVTQIQLPLLAPSAAPLDLKALLIKVSGIGFSSMSAGAWTRLSDQLQERDDLGPVLRAVYAFFLLPVELGMTASEARRTAALEWLNSRVSERKKVAFCEQGIRPTVGSISRASSTADKALQQWGEEHGSCEEVARLALRLARCAARDPVGMASGMLMYTSAQAEAEAIAAGAWSVGGGATTGRGSKARGKRGREGTDPSPPPRARSRVREEAEEQRALSDAGGEEGTQAAGVVDSAMGAVAVEQVQADAGVAAAAGGQAGATSQNATAASGAPAGPLQDVDMPPAVTAEEPAQAAQPAAGDTAPAAAEPADTAAPAPAAPAPSPSAPGPSPSAPGPSPSAPAPGPAAPAPSPAAPSPAPVASPAAAATTSASGPSIRPDGAPPVVARADARPLPDQMSLEEMSACQSLVVSWRQRRSAYPGHGVCGAPNLTLQFAQQYEADTGLPAERLGSLSREATPDIQPNSLPPGRVRTFLGVTPKCGSCTTCSRPSMKQACEVNRGRMKNGQEPVLWNPKTKEFEVIGV